MVTAVVLVAELDLFSIDVDHLDLVGGTKTDVGAFPGIDVTNDGLDEGAQISRGAMMHFEHNGGVAIVFDRLSFAEIVRCGHDKS
jgi:hypothetical protein